MSTEKNEHMSAMAGLQNAIDCLTAENRTLKMELIDLRQDSKMLRQKLSRNSGQQQQRDMKPSSQQASTDCSNPTTPLTTNDGTKPSQFSFQHASLEDFEKLREQVKFSALNVSCT